MRVALIILMALLALRPAGVPVAADTHDGAPTRLVLFYHPPEDGTPLETVAARYGALIFTRGDERYRDQLRAAGFTGPVLQYLLANEATGPAEARRAGDPCGRYPYYPDNVAGIAGDFCAELHGDERNFLHNGRGERLYGEWCAGRGSTAVRVWTYQMNPAAPAWRAYFFKRARENLQTLGYDGLYLDNIDLSLDRGLRQQNNSDGTVQEFASQEAFRAAVAGFLAEMRTALGDARVWANLTGQYNADTDWGPYLPYLDGVFNEYFVAQWDRTYAPPDVWENQLRQAETVLGEGKTFVAVAQGPRDDRDRMRFGLASYLLVSGPGAYFRYADAHAPDPCEDPDHYAEAWLYEEYLTRLGQPTGPRFKDGDRWRRDFTCGYVTVDVAAHAATIVTNAGC